MHRTLLFLSAAVLFFLQASADRHPVRNLRARYDARSGSIFVEWEPLPVTDRDGIQLRYKATTRTGSSSDWQVTRADRDSNNVRLAVEDLKNGDELMVQVKRDSSHAWGDPLVIAIAKRTQIGELVVDEADLLPPLNFTANVLGPSNVRLDWSPSPSAVSSSDGWSAEVVDSPLYYIVNVRQLTSVSGEDLLRQQIKVESTTFLLDNLVPGERYELTIRSAKSSEHVSSTAAIVEISMPKEDEFFEVGNLIISSRFKGDGKGVVNLTWEVPAKMAGKIVSYDVKYLPANLGNSGGRWSQILFSGDTPSALLYGLKSDTEYILKIKTILRNNVETESGEFRFRTPKVTVNPIGKVELIYSSETNDVRIQWILAPHIYINHVRGFDVYLTEDKEQPEDRWRYISLDTRDTQLSLDDLKSSTTYYVKVNVRNVDGTVLQSPSIYRFTTIDQVPPQRSLESRLPSSLGYRNVSPGRVSVTWSYPPSIAHNVAGTTIFYTDQNHEHIDRWQRIKIEDADQRSVVLVGLREATIYYIQIAPTLYSGELDFGAVQKFQLRTSESTGTESFADDDSDEPVPRSRWNSRSRLPSRSMKRRAT